MKRDGLVNKYEAADLVGVSWRTVERWVTEGKLERFATGKHGAAFYLISDVRQAERLARRGAAPNPGAPRRRPKNLCVRVLTQPSQPRNVTT